MIPERQTSAIPVVLERLLAVCVAVGGFALSWRLFFPGIATHDVIAVYDQAYAGAFGDWQPPLLGWVWVRLEPFLGYGPRALFVPTIAVYWLAFLVLFLGLRRHGAVGAWLALLVAFTPPLFAILGVLWRDVIFAACWLLAFAIVLLARPAGLPLRGLALAVAIPFFLFGFLIRPNALFAAAPIALFLVSPALFSWRRLLVVGVPVLVVLQLGSNFVNYTLLQAKRENAIHSVFVFDLTGISHFADTNVFPIDDWTPAQVEKVKTGCYDPAYWDAIWWPDCSFAMERINRDEPKGTKLFGSDRLRDAWFAAILAHPVAYAKHRLSHFNVLMTQKMLVIFNQAVSGQHRFFFVKDRAFSIFDNANGWLNDNTMLFRGLPWLIVNIICLGFGFAVRSGPLRAAIIALPLSGLIYAATYGVFGVAAEYRYLYWSTATALAGCAIVLSHLGQVLRDRREKSVFS